jgi:hypothetical protein
VTAAAVTVNTSGNTSGSGHLKAGSFTGIESVSSTLGGADAGNYTFAGATGDYTVSPLALSASIAAGSSIYGSALTPGAATFSNAVVGDVVTAAAVTVNTGSNTSSSGHLKAGSYTGIESLGGTLGGADAGNYTFAGAAGNYTVNPLALTGSIAAGSSVYGAALTPGAATFSNAVVGDVVTAAAVAVNTGGNTSSSGHLKAGSYISIESVGALGGGDAGNYTFTGATGNYTVSPLALTASIAAGTSIYGSTLAPGAATFGNAVVGDVVTAAAVAVNTGGNTSSSSGHLKAGSYTGIESVSGTLGGADAGNYIFGGATGNYTVNPLALTGSIAAGSSVYGAALTPGAATFSNAVAGDVVTAAAVTVNTRGNTSSSGHLKAGSYAGSEAVSGLSGADAGNYTFAGATGNYVVSPLAITVAATGASRVYDGTAIDAPILTSSGLIGGDQVSFVESSATFANKNVGNAKTVSVSGIAAGGADAGNYSIGNSTASTTANITPATLTYSANPASFTAGQTPSSLSGSLGGFVGNDSSANATTGTLAWSTDAGPASVPGRYVIDGGGLAAANYVFVQAADNATALTLNPGTLPLPVLNVIAALDSNLPDAESNISSANLDNQQHNFSMRVIDGGVKLPNNIANTNE